MPGGGGGGEMVSAKTESCVKILWNWGGEGLSKYPIFLYKKPITASQVGCLDLSNKANFIHFSKDL